MQLATVSKGAAQGNSYTVHETSGFDARRPARLFTQKSRFTLEGTVIAATGNW
jgi:hypothetical protein